MRALLDHETELRVYRLLELHRILSPKNIGRKYGLNGYFIQKLKDFGSRDAKPTELAYPLSLERCVEDMKL